MNIDEKGFGLSNLKDVLNAYELQLQCKFGPDFFIKPEGIIDNIVVSAGFMEMSIQEQLAFLAKQFDPETAEGIWQDALFERLGVSRLNSIPTFFDLKIQGTPGYSGSENSITIRQNTSNQEFFNTSTYTFDVDGFATLQFESLIEGKIEVASTDLFKIVQAPDKVSKIPETIPERVSLGRDRENDLDYKIRFKNSKAINAKATRNANEANLSKYVNNIAFLKIIDKKSDPNFEPGTLAVIAKHNTTNQIFANAIFNSVADGIELLGETAVGLKDDSGQDVTIKFKNADEVYIEFFVNLKMRYGYFFNNVCVNVKNNILKYIKKRVFGLGSTIYATEFIIPILEVDGVEAVFEIKIKKDSDIAFNDIVCLNRDEIPEFIEENMTFNPTITTNNVD